MRLPPTPEILQAIKRSEAAQKAAQTRLQGLPTLKEQAAQRARARKAVKAARQRRIKAYATAKASRPKAPNTI